MAKIIMVFDVPADCGGALTILNEYYNNAVNDPDKNIKWIFVVGLPFLKDTDNVKILRFPWIKKTWLHRLFFDFFVAHKLITSHKTTEILSLQNVIVPRTKIPQTLYLHQPLPFVSRKFKITENFLFWIYQNIIARSIFSSIKKADKIIVQTIWMKEACINKTEILSDKIIIDPPKMNFEIKNAFIGNKTGFQTFFYPASGVEFKNHKLIIQAALLLKQQKVNNYTIIFTLEGDENKKIIKLYNLVKEHSLPIQFIGKITHEQVYDYYSKSTLIFPSYIETFGLPLLEAKLHKCPILASDCPFSHEILEDYDNVRFFSPDDASTLAEYMKNAVSYDKHNL